MHASRCGILMASLVELVCGLGRALYQSICKKLRLTVGLRKTNFSNPRLSSEPGLRPSNAQKEVDEEQQIAHWAPVSYGAHLIYTVCVYIMLYIKRIFLRRLSLPCHAHVRSSLENASAGRLGICRRVWDALLLHGWKVALGLDRRFRISWVRSSDGRNVEGCIHDGGPSLVVGG